MKALIRILWCCLLIVTPSVGWAATLRVPQDYLTIQNAVDAAQAGDTVLIAPGKYQEAVSLRSGVKLQGAGNTTELSDTLRLENVEGVEISELQVRGTGQDSHFGIFCVNADVRIHHVTVRDFHHGISAESSRLTIREAKITASFNVGILIARSTEALIEENIITKNATGIIIGDTQRDVTLRKNRIQENQTGIECHNANPRLRENVIDGNAVGMQIDNANPDLGTETDPGKNVFVNNEQWAIQYTGRRPLMALMNWWGQPTGPLAGQVIGQVQFEPWLRGDPRAALAVSHQGKMPVMWGRLKQGQFGEKQ